jgi:AraC-like DNA-binding protein
LADEAVAERVAIGGKSLGPAEPIALESVAENRKVFTLQPIADTNLSVDEISRRVGYAEPSTLRRRLRRDSSRSPSGLRRGV